MGPDYPVPALLVSLSSLSSASDASESTAQFFSVANTTVESLEVVLESLVDLTCDPTFLPCLFASFDCDLRHRDLVQPLVQMLSRAAGLVITTGLDRLGRAKELGVAVVLCYRQLLSALHRRKALEEAHRESQKKVSNQSEVGGSASNVVSHSSALHNTSSANKARLCSEAFFHAREMKALVIAASEKFNKKPSDGLRFLQEHHLLTPPVSAASVASFLRSSPRLSRAAVGSFLGELGKAEGQYVHDW
ncbi:hypothetical protein EON64_07975, partial [archaeon]